MRTIDADVFMERMVFDTIADHLEEDRELAYADFDRYVEEVDPCFDSECDDFFYTGLGRAIKVLKEGGKND